MGNVLVWLVDVIDSDNGQVSVISEIAKSKASTRLRSDFVNSGLIQVEANWHGEKVAVSETVVLNDAGAISFCARQCLDGKCSPIVVLLVHETYVPILSAELSGMSRSASRSPCLCNQFSNSFCM